MGYRRITTEVDVYSCEHCGWVGPDPNAKKVPKLEEGQMGRLALGSREGRAYLRYDCPLCKAPIRPSPPVELLRVASVDELLNSNGSSSRRHAPQGSANTDPAPEPVSSPGVEDGED